MIGIMDYDFLALKRGLAPPSIAALKTSAYLKTTQKDEVHLMDSLDNAAAFKEIYFFSNKPIDDLPKEIFLLENIKIYGENLEKVPKIIEHMTPDITLYNNFVQERVLNKIASPNRAVQFLDSIYYQAYGSEGERIPLPPSMPRKRFYIYDKDFLTKENCWEILDEIYERTPSGIYMVEPIQCHTVKQFFTLREDYEKVSRANKIILDYFVPLFQFDIYFSKYKLKLLGEITKTSDIYVYIGKNYGNNAYNEVFYIKNLFYCLNLIFSYWSRNIPIKAEVYYYENALNPYKDIYNCIRSWTNNDNLDLTLDDAFNTKKLIERKETFLKEHYIFQKFFGKSKNDLIHTRGIWNIS